MSNSQQSVTTESASLSPLRAIRRALGVRPEDLAARAEIGIATLYSAERGDHSPTRTTRRAISNALGVPVETLWPPAQGGSYEGPPRSFPGTDDDAEAAEQSDARR